MGSKNV
jgi:hypothetical protein